MSVFSKNLLIAFLAAFLQNETAIATICPGDFAPPPRVDGDDRDAAPGLPHPKAAPAPAVEEVHLNLRDLPWLWDTDEVFAADNTLHDVVEHALTQDFYNVYFPGVYVADDFEILHMEQGWATDAGVDRRQTLADLIRTGRLSDGDGLTLFVKRGLHLNALEWFHHLVSTAIPDVRTFHRLGGRPLYSQEQLRHGYRPRKAVPTGRVSALRELSTGNYTSLRSSSRRVSARAAKQLAPLLKQLVPSFGKRTGAAEEGHQHPLVTLPNPARQQLAEFLASHRNTTSSQFGNLLGSLPDVALQKVRENIINPNSKGLLGLRNHLRSWQFQTFARGYPELGAQRVRGTFAGRDKVEAFRVAGPGADYAIQTVDFDWCFQHDEHGERRDERPVLHDLARIIGANGGWEREGVDGEDHEDGVAHIRWVRLDIHLLDVHQNRPPVAEGAARASATLTVGVERTLLSNEQRTVVWRRSVSPQGAQVHVGTGGRC